MYLNALPGKGVHVVTVNDYLAQRDAEWMGPGYNFLGLTVGVILAQPWTTDKKAAYAATSPTAPTTSSASTTCATTWRSRRATASRAAALAAIVDEVDSILIDEARTPLIIRPGRGHTELYREASTPRPRSKQIGAGPARAEPGDFTVDEKRKQVHLSEAGHEHAEDHVHRGRAAAARPSLYDPSNITLMHHV